MLPHSILSSADSQTFLPMLSLTALTGFPRSTSLPACAAYSVTACQLAIIARLLNRVNTHGRQLAGNITYPEKYFIIFGKQPVPNSRLFGTLPAYKRKINRAGKYKKSKIEISFRKKNSYIIIVSSRRSLKRCGDEPPKAARRIFNEVSFPCKP